ncbi:siroheme synthase [Cyathus striatus]|nr:siroheme synthase [Cyathus striatus]
MVSLVNLSKVTDKHLEDIKLNQLGGGSLLIAWQLKGKNVLIVGGGKVAAQRIDSILATDAHIRLMAPLDGLGKRSRKLLELLPDRIHHIDKEFTGADDLNGIEMVLTAIDDHHRSLEIVQLCRETRIPVNAADIPDLCDFYFGAQIRDGPLQIMISTNGNGPRISAIVKNRISSALTGYEGHAITNVGKLRAMLKEREPDTAVAASKRRMDWMTQLCNEWNIEDFTVLTEDTMKRLLEEGFEKNRVPAIEEVGGTRKQFITSFRDTPSTTYTLIACSTTGFLIGALCAASIFMYHSAKH